MSVRLSNKQRDVLARLISGDEIWTVSGRHPQCFWINAKNIESPGFHTLWALEKRGLVVAYHSDLSGSKYAISAAGREAMRGALK